MRQLNAFSFLTFKENQMNTLLIAALLTAGLAQATAAEPTETGFNKFLVYGTVPQANKTLTITGNPKMALMVEGTDSHTMDRISRGKLLCSQVTNEKRRQIQKTVLAQNATVAQLEQAIALGLEIPDQVGKDYEVLRLQLKFVNDAGDAPYYMCK